jgi:hypothetical protein
VVGIEKARVCEGLEPVNVKTPLPAEENCAGLYEKEPLIESPATTAAGKVIPGGDGSTVPENVAMTLAAAASRIVSPVSRVNSNIDRRKTRAVFFMVNSGPEITG